MPRIDAPDRERSRVQSRAESTAGAVQADPFDSIEWEALNATEITPSWIGGHGLFRRGTDAAGRGIVKREYPSQIDLYADRGAIALALRVAGDERIGARAHSVSDTAAVLEWLPAPWRRARLNDLVDPVLRASVIDQHLRFQRTTLPELPSRDVISDVFLLRDACLAEGAILPAAVNDLLRTLGPFLRRYDSFAEPVVPCHGDGAVSNVMFRSPCDVLLTGWTFAARRDPLQEAGSLLAELSPHCLPAEELVVQMGFTRDNDVVHVVRCLAICDGIQWALVGYLNSASAPDRSVDYFKYGSWRLANAHAILQSPGLCEWIGGLR